ncbi:MAG TPA: VCBS repeat-containing protein [Candidatus Competibacteraceae bacterium]|nr:VCBS repeat-containing protein [Candidatus Competibacteraceae bacterium]
MNKWILRLRPLLGMVLLLGAVTQTIAGTDSVTPPPTVSNQAEPAATSTPTVSNQAEPVAASGPAMAAEPAKPTMDLTKGHPTESAPVWSAPENRYTEFLVDSGAFHVLAADLSGTGRKDLAFTSHSGDIVRVYRQTAPRQFVAVDPQDIVGFHPNDIIVLSNSPKRYLLNAEGAGELRVAEVNAEGRFKQLAKYPLGNVLSSTPFSWPGWGPISLAVAPYTGTAITLLRDFNPETAEVKDVLTLPVGRDPKRVQVVDIDKDGTPELILPSFWDNQIWAISYAGPDQPPKVQVLASFKRGWPRQVLPLDVNHDGAMDLLVPMSTRERIAVLLNDGQGHFHEGESIPYPGKTGIHTLASGKDGEGRYLLAGGSGALVLYRERQNTPGQFETLLAPIQNWPNWVELVDVDVDGSLDAVIASQDAQESRVIYGPLWKAFSQLAGQPNESKQQESKQQDATKAAKQASEEEKK